MIAKSLFLEPDFPSHFVRLVVTLATPHSPVLLTDPLLRDYYQRVTPLGPNVTVISLGGGVKDLVVRGGLTLTNAADISALVCVNYFVFCLVLRTLFHVFFLLYFILL